MEINYSNIGENFDIIIFNFDDRNWEIIIDKLLNQYDIKLLVMKRVDELTDEFLQYNSYDFSDLIVDYTTKKDELNGNKNN